MRLALLVHGLPPERCTGVEVHALALARAWAARGVQVEVFTQCVDDSRDHLSQEREGIAPRLAVTRLAVNRRAEDERGRRIVRGAADAFARFLDRERPHVLHVEHALGVGPGGLQAARDRGIPVVHQAHDPLAISLDHLVLRTDATPLPLGADGRPAADDLARNALARAALERALPVGSHGAVVLREWLPAALAEDVRAILDDRLTGDRADEHARLSAELASEADEWRAAFDGVDVFCASSEGLADSLRAGGVRVDRVVPCGIDASALRASRDERDAHAPLRCGVLGGLRPHKGAHVALAAFTRMVDDAGSRDCGATLLLAGEAEGLESGSLRARAADVGATVAGAFTPDALPALLATLDVVLVPSIWPENAPFVIREAFAAGVPVVASRIGAVPESLEAGGGVLVRPNDADDLARALRELADDRERYAELARSVPAPLTIEDEAARWTELHRELASARDERRADDRDALPEHLHAFAARCDTLHDLPLRELVRRALQGVDALEKDVLPDRDAATAFAAALEAADGPRESLATAARAERAARVSADEHRAARDAFAAESSWREEALRERERELAWRERVAREAEAESEWRAEQLASARDALAAKQAEFDEARAARDAERERAAWLQDRVATLDGEAAWLRERAAHADAERAWHEATANDRAAHLDEARAALADLRATIAAIEAERDWRADQAAANERRAASAEALLDDAAARADAAQHRASALESSIADRAAHEAFLRGELESLARALGVELGDDAAWPDALARAREELSRRTHALSATTRELAWRADEMRAACAEASRGLARRIGAAALRRARGWTISEREGGAS